VCHWHGQWERPMDLPSPLPPQVPFCKTSPLQLKPSSPTDLQPNLVLR
jgi:hypothetical protein